MASELRRCYIPSFVEGKRSAYCASASTSASAFWSRRRGNDSAQRRRPRPLVRAYLRAGNKSPRTVETYLEALAGFSAHLVATPSVRLIRPAARTSRPGSRFSSAVCAGKDFEARRDTAVLMVLLDAGPRRSQLLGMRLGDLDFEYDVVRVVGKGGRERALPFGRKSAMALDRYLRARSCHRLAHLDALWLWLRGPWHTLPSWYAVSAADRVIDPELQRFFAQRARSTTVQFDDASHAGGFTHYATRFVKLIEQAVQATAS
jgi:integrase